MHKIQNTFLFNIMNSDLNAIKEIWHGCDEATRSLLLTAEYQMKVGNGQLRSEPIITWAVKVNKLPVVEFLLQQGVNINATGYHDKNAVFHIQSIEMLELLKKHGINFFHTDRSGLNALFYAISLPILQALIALKVDPHITPQGINLLYYHLQRCRYHICEYLLSSGYFSVNDEDSRGYRIIDYMISRENTPSDTLCEQINFLIRYGAEINYIHIIDENRAFSPLTLAIEYGKQEALQLLINARVDINKIHIMHFTLLMQKKDMLPILIQAGAFLNHLSEPSLLSIAIKQEDIELGKQILKMRGKYNHSMYFTLDDIQHNLLQKNDIIKAAILEDKWSNFKYQIATYAYNECREKLRRCDIVICYFQEWVDIYRIYAELNNYNVNTVQYTIFITQFFEYSSDSFTKFLSMKLIAFNDAICKIEQQIEHSIVAAYLLSCDAFNESAHELIQQKISDICEVHNLKRDYLLDAYKAIQNIRKVALAIHGNKFDIYNFIPYRPLH